MLLWLVVGWLVGWLVVGCGWLVCHFQPFGRSVALLVTITVTATLSPVTTVTTTVVASSRRHHHRHRVVTTRHPPHIHLLLSAIDEV